MSLLTQMHDVVHRRRVRVLSKQLAQLIPPNSSVLDVGCGDALIGQLITQRKSDVRLEGIDVMVRKHTNIPVHPFNGTQIPHEDKSFDVVMFVDVLHHTEEPMILLREARRVARQAVIIKDHTRNGILAGATLRLMDWVGNARHEVVLPYNYWSRHRWLEAFDELGLRIDTWIRRLGLYPAPASWIFGRSLHFLAKLALSDHTATCSRSRSPERSTC